MDALNDALKARMYHRRFQRVKRYDPTATYTPEDPGQPTQPPTSNPPNPPANTPPTSVPSEC